MVLAIINTPTCLIIKILSASNLLQFNVNANFSLLENELQCGSGTGTDPDNCYGMGILDLSRRRRRSGMPKALRVRGLGRGFTPFPVD